MPKKNRNRLDKLCCSCHGNKKGGLHFFLYSFHQTSWKFVGISTVVCVSFWRVDKIQNGRRCHGNQGIKWPPNTKILRFLGEIWLPSRLWCCELIFIIGLLWRLFLIQNGRQNTKILRFGRNFDVGNWYPWFGSHIMIHFVGISTVVCDSFWGLKKFKMAAVAMVTKVQNGHQIQKSSDLGENGRRCHKKREKLKVLGIGWNLIEML